MTFSFELPPKSNRPKSGECIIYCVCRLSYNGKRYPDKKFAATYSGGIDKIRIPQEYWIPYNKTKLKRGQRYNRVNPDYPFAEDVNANLDRLETNAKIIKRRVTNDFGICTPEKFMLYWGIEFSQNPVLDMWDKYTEIKNQKYSKHNASVLKNVRNKLQFLEPLTFHSFDSAFPDLFLTKAGIAEGTARSYLNHIKAFLKYGIKHSWHKNKDFETWEMPERSAREFSLTYEEVKQFFEANLTGDFARCRDFWLFSFYLGLRKSEILNLKVIENPKYGPMFKYKVLKQKKERFIEFVPPIPAWNLYNKYQGNFFDFSLRTLAIKTKKAAELAGIEPNRAKQITLHSARHTFITLAKERGFTLDQIRTQTGQTRGIISLYDHAQEQSTIASEFAKLLE